MATIFELWVSGCKRNNTEIFRIEGKGDTGIYLTKTKFLQNHNYYYSTPIYHVWIKGKWLLCTQNIRTAYELYNKELL